MESLKLRKNDPCPCNSGKKYRQCCWLKRLGVGTDHQPLSEPPANPKTTVIHQPPDGPTYWSAPPGQPDAAPPAGAEWTEWVFVKDRGWTHERDLKPGDQVRQKGGGWAAVPEPQEIYVTQEHPFYVKSKGWTPLSQIKPGDEIRGENGWVTVSEVTPTNRYETVYNFRVADHHTYFVGKPEWGFSVWAHNASYAELMNATNWSEMQARRALRLLKDKGPEAFGIYAAIRLPAGLSVEAVLAIAQRGVSATGQKAPLIGRSLSSADKATLAKQVADALKVAHAAGAEPVLPAAFLQTSKRTRTSIMQLAVKDLPAELRHGNSLDSLMPNIGYRLVRERDGAVWKYGITDDFRGVPGEAGFHQGRYTPADLLHGEAGEPLRFEHLVGPDSRRALAQWETATIKGHTTQHGRPAGNPVDR